MITINKNYYLEQNSNRYHLHYVRKNDNGKEIDKVIGYDMHLDNAINKISKLMTGSEEDIPIDEYIAKLEEITKFVCDRVFHCTTKDLEPNKDFYKEEQPLKPNEVVKMTGDVTINNDPVTEECVTTAEAVKQVKEIIKPKNKKNASKDSIKKRLF